MGIRGKHLYLYFLLFLPVLANGQEDLNAHWSSIHPDQSIDHLTQFKELYNQEETKEWSTEQKITFLKKGFEAAITLSAKPEQIYFSNQLGNQFHQIDSFSQAIYFLKYPIQLNYDTISVARAYNRLGYFYFDVGDYKNALDNYFKAVKYGKLLNKGWETYPFGNITNVYKHLEDYDNAIKYAKASMAIDAKTAFPENAYGAVYNYTNLLIFNDKKNQADSCLHYIDLINENIIAIDTFQKEHYRDAIHYAHLTIANYYTQNNQLDLAKEHLDLARKDNKEHNRIGFSIAEGKYWLKKENFNMVKKIIQELESSNLQNFGTIEEIQQLKIDYYTAIRDYQNVVQIQDALFNIQKNKFGEDRLRYSAFADAEFKNLEQKQKISSLENQRKLENLRSRIQTFIYLITFLIFIGLTTFWWYRNRQNKKLSIYLDEQVHLKTQELEQANNELRTFNYIASHDIKEPIRNISNYASLIHKKLPLELQTQLGDYFKIIKQGTKQLYTLIEDFAHYMTLSKDKNIELRAVDLNEIVENLENGLEETINQKNGKVINHGLPHLQSNASLLFIILKNLIDNGIKFNTSNEPTVEISYHKSKDFHEISVRDNGIGIEPEYFEQIFGMFSRLHHREAYQGSGIGLAIVKLLTQKLKGSVTLVSEIGTGSQFTIHLPT